MAGFIDLIIPKEKKFFEHLEKQITLLTTCIDELEGLKQKNLDQKRLTKVVQKIRKKSDEANSNTQIIINFLHQTFITPIDREEIKSLATQTGLVIDAVERFAPSLAYFRVKTVNPYTNRQLTLIKEATDILASIFKQSMIRQDNRKRIERIKILEDQADDIYMQAVADLFKTNHNAIAIIKQKELYTHAEDIIDGIAHVADFIETIIINNT